MNLLDEILETWRTHNELNLFLLDYLNEDGLRAVTLLKTGQPSKGRNVARQFAHMHEVRLMWLEGSRRDLVAGIARCARGEEPSKEWLERALRASGEVVATAVREAIERDTPIKRAKSPVVWLGYLISHESHHRGQIALALKQSGRRLPDEIAYGLWTHWHGRPYRRGAET